MQHFTRDELDRDEKLLIDSLRDPVEARRRLDGARCDVLVEPALLQSRLAQAAMLTIAATLSRSHRAGVTFVLERDVALAVRGNAGDTLFDELLDAGGHVATEGRGAPVIAIGAVNVPRGARGVRLLVDGGSGGCAPLSEACCFDVEGFVPTAIMAASLASLELFRLNALGESDAGVDVKIATLVEGLTRAELVALERELPDRLWFIGAGHLGQGAMFVAALCGAMDDARLYKLQDHDSLIQANRSTQILLRGYDRGKKIQVCARWLRERGIESVPEPAPLGADTPGDERFEVIVAGLDDPEPRQLLENPGAQLVVDAGIGGLASTFASFRVHTFPGPERASRVFARASAISEALHREDLADFYAAQVDDDPDHVCGARDVAGVSAGVPFVGTAVAAVTITEIMRRAAGMPGNYKIGGDLRQRRPISIRITSDPRVALGGHAPRAISTLTP